MISHASEVNSAQRQRHLLIVAYEFPPIEAGGVARTLKFCKFLPEFGWLPHILTVKMPKDCIDQKIAECSDLSVIRTPSFEYRGDLRIPRHLLLAIVSLMAYFGA